MLTKHSLLLRAAVLLCDSFCDCCGLQRVLCVVELIAVRLCWWTAVNCMCDIFTSDYSYLKFPMYRSDYVWTSNFICYQLCAVYLPCWMSVSSCVSHLSQTWSFSDLATAREHQAYRHNHSFWSVFPKFPKIIMEIQRCKKIFEGRQNCRPFKGSNLHARHAPLVFFYDA